VILLQINHARFSCPKMTTLPTEKELKLSIGELSGTQQNPVIIASDDSDISDDDAKATLSEIIGNIKKLNSQGYAAVFDVENRIKFRRSRVISIARDDVVRDTASNIKSSI
jgi:hypothetical protein